MKWSATDAASISAFFENAFVKRVKRQHLHPHRQIRPFHEGRADPDGAGPSVVEQHNRRGGHVPELSFDSTADVEEKFLPTNNPSAPKKDKKDDDD